ncbi:MAG: hypothetical protein U0232_25555 [Thermomicrobiales bacterium]
MDSAGAIKSRDAARQRADWRRAAAFELALQAQHAAAQVGGYGPDDDDDEPNRRPAITRLLRRTLLTPLKATFDRRDDSKNGAKRGTALPAVSCYATHARANLPFAVAQ